jgi:carbonic anhydrase
MQKSFASIINGYKSFRKKYASGDNHLMQRLSAKGQSPEIMMIACCDSRVDPALLLQCEPGDLFVVRNVANIVPPYESDGTHHGTSAALEFGICYLKVKHLIILGHSQCGGMEALMTSGNLPQDDFISNWVDLASVKGDSSVDACAKSSLIHSYDNCLTFPWIQKRVNAGNLIIHLWFFDIKSSEIYTYQAEQAKFETLPSSD